MGLGGEGREMTEAQKGVLLSASHLRLSTYTQLRPETLIELNFFLSKGFPGRITSPASPDSTRGRTVLAMA